MNRRFLDKFLTVDSHIESSISESEKAAEFEDQVKDWFLSQPQVDEGDSRIEEKIIPLQQEIILLQQQIEDLRQLNRSLERKLEILLRKKRSAF